MTRLLGIDFGTRRLGFALGDPMVGRARPLETYTRSRDWGTDLKRVHHHVESWEASEVVVGIPFLLDGGETAATERARAFADRLAGELELPVFRWDETLTSFEADARMDEDGIPAAQRKAHRDGYAAAVMLDEVLQHRNTGRT